ncbi:MAG: hypothetical protein KDC90_19760, partial [Ignavibacteriae bacterium]|nr:hypothetical protein [Ignavibacteriota bacterium]
MKLIKLRIRSNPDIYILGFRGHEIFFPVRLITLGKTLVFDEFISIHDALTKENKESNIPMIFFSSIYLIEKLILKFSDLIITDTPAHKELITEKYKKKKKK